MQCNVVICQVYIKLIFTLVSHVLTARRLTVNNDNNYNNNNNNNNNDNNSNFFVSKKLMMSACNRLYQHHFTFNLL